jgi:hypothetical protein
MSMRTSNQGRYCGICENGLHGGFFSLSKRSQTVNSTPSGDVVMVAHDDLVTDFCSHQCAEYAEAAITSTLTSAYPTDGRIVPCSLCLRPVDRAAPHVSVSMTEFEDASQPWLVSARVCDERELGVYCSNCAKPHTAAEAEPQHVDSTSNAFAGV